MLLVGQIKQTITRFCLHYLQLFYGPAKENLNKTHKTS